jgi:membrane protein DedA with SNARE-associated domain
MHGLYQGLWVWVQAHGMHGVFAFMFLENLAIPFPTELGFITAQGLINTHFATYPSAYLVIVFGHLCGAAVTYYSGRAGHGFLVARFAHSPRLVKARELMEKWYARWGSLTVLAGRLLGQVRPWSSLIAGMAKVPPLQFWLWTVIGTMIYAASAMWFTIWGWYFWRMFPWIRVPALIVMFGIFYGVSGFAVVREYVRRHRRRKTAEAEAAEEASGETRDAS